MKRTTMLLAALLSCLVGGWGDDSQDSLVGTWKIASDAELAQETISLFFRQENDTDYPATLSYSLSPNGRLMIEKGRDHAACCFGGINKHLTDFRRQVQISERIQIEIRRMFARLRPQALSKDGPSALPQGCYFTYDSRSWNVVHFYRGKSGGAFIFQPECKGSGADKVKRLLRSIVAVMPPVDGSEAFLEGH